MTFPDKPKRPYSNFAAYYTNKVSSSLYKSILFPCLRCYGEAQVKDKDNYERDVIEGYKMCPWIKCSTCRGTGKSSEEEYKKLYKQTIEHWRKELAEYKEQVKPMNDALEKLTSKERKILGLPTRKL